MAAKKSSQTSKKTTVEKSVDYRIVFSNVQSWATTDNDLVLTFLRAEPQVPGGTTGTKFDLSSEHYAQEVTVYLSIPQAEQMAHGILASIANAGATGKVN